MIQNPLSKKISIGKREIGAGCKTYIIAEAGVNHNGDLARAKEMVIVAAQAGADAIKFQTFNAEKLASASAPKAEYQSRNTSEGSQLELLRTLELKAKDFAELKNVCAANDIEFLSSPFEEDSVDLLHSIGMEAFKIPSGEVTNPFYLQHVAKKQKPIILSTGMCSLAEVETAVNILYDAGNSQIIILHCVSSYPAPAQEVNLNAMQTLRQKFNLPVGFSDHTMGLTVPFAAVALGACVIEKHFTLDRKLSGPDHQASLEPEELKQLVSGIREIEVSLGDGIKRMMPCEKNTAEVARKSVTAARNLKAGSVIKREDLTVMRPGTGLAPATLTELIGKKVKTEISAGTLISWEMVE